MDKKPLYVVLARTVQARENCINTGNREWEEKHEERIDRLINECLPSGSGIDGNTEIDWDYSNGERMRFFSEYHAMNDGGYYNGWINFTVTVKPSLQFGFYLDISGNFGKYGDLKEYLQEVYDSAFSELVNEY